MPDKRPTDNMELKVDLPQEEEFALSNMMPYTYYNFWFFPKRWMEYCDRYLLFNDITEEERRIFMDTFMRPTDWKIFSKERFAMVIVENANTITAYSIPI